MASSTSIPASKAVQVLLSMLADGSSSVREASMSSLKSIAPLNPLCVFECCAVLSRGGREFGNMAGVFQVMAFGVRSLDTRDVDSAFMAKLAKIATAELISPKVLPIDELVRVSLQVVTNKPSTRSIDDILNKFIPPVDNNEKLEDSGSNKNIKC